MSNQSDSKKWVPYLSRALLVTKIVYIILECNHLSNFKDLQEIEEEVSG